MSVYSVSFEIPNQNVKVGFAQRITIPRQVRHAASDLQRLSDVIPANVFSVEVERAELPRFARFEMF